MRNIRHEVFGTNKGLDSKIKLNQASGVLCEDQRVPLGEETPTPCVWVDTEPEGFINCFLPRTPEEPRFTRGNCGITGFNEPGSFGPLSSHQALSWQLHNGLISSKENQATPPDTLSTAQAERKGSAPHRSSAHSRAHPLSRLALITMKFPQTQNE